MNTKLDLDVTRRELTEPVFSFYRSAWEIPVSIGKYKIYSWPISRTITLYPINFAPSFSETASWEPLKFRLDPSVVSYDSDYWKEVPERTLPDGTKCDYFYAAKVTSSNYPASLINPILTNLTDQVGFIPLPVLGDNSDNSVHAIVSQEAGAENAAYYLRWYQEGRPTMRRYAIMVFYFSTYALRLNSNGTAELWFTKDFTQYFMVQQWQWADAKQVHVGMHSMAIFPHARNKIEFVSGSAPFSTNPQPINYSGKSPVPSHTENNLYSATYQIPGDLVPLFDETTGELLEYLITLPGPWGLSVSREFRPHIQVSKLAFFNGTDGNSGLWDQPFLFDVAPTVTPTLTPHGELNGGTYTSNLYSGDLRDGYGQPFLANGFMQQAQFRLTIKGIGDIAGPGRGSTTSPEFYGYSVDKPALFTNIVGAFPTEVSTLSQTMDRGGAPDAERLTVTLGNSLGELSNFERRADIPLQLGDLDTGIILFEGRSESSRVGKAPGNNAQTIELECKGMAEVLLRRRFSRNQRTNFGRDPLDDDGRAWPIGACIRRIFETGGFDPLTQVVIEQENEWLRFSNGEFFRLWLDGGSGGTKGGVKTPGDGHNQQTVARWWPAFGTPIYEFADYLIRGVLGWNFVWSTLDHRWHIYRRPRPQDFSSLPIRAAFWGTTPLMRQARIDFPDIYHYTHRNLLYENQKPSCTTVNCGSIVEKLVDTKLIPIMQLTTPNTLLIPNKFDPRLDSEKEVTWVTIDNPNGYVSPQHPTPDKTSPDYIGQRRDIVVPLAMVANKDALEWFTRRTYDDNAHGYTFGKFNARWGDAGTFNLRKWDRIWIDGENFLLDRIEPEWRRDQNPRAVYRASLMRNDAPPPR